MKSLFRSIFISLLLFVSINASANESTSPVNKSSESKKRFSIEGMLTLDGEGLVINPNIAINDKVSLGIEFLLSKYIEGLNGTVKADYYFSSFSTDSFFLSPHIDVNSYSNGDDILVTKYGYGLDLGYRFIVNENISIRPMLSNFQTFGGSCPYGTVFPFIPYLTVGYTW
jgi:hypothetical protein